MRAVIVIPARYASTRFPGKPLAMIAGKSLIQRVYERAVTSRLASSVYVATDDDRIASHVSSFGGRVVMPQGEFATGGDRIAAAIPLIDEIEEAPCEAVVNIQGDEPLIDMESVDRLIGALDGADLATLATPITTETDFLDRNVVKVVCDLRGRALYFSRSAIPNGSSEPALRHIGVYAYRRDALLSLAALPRSPLEEAEQLEQLRALQNGFTIQVEQTPRPHLGVDLPDDVERVERELLRHEAAS